MYSIDTQKIIVKNAKTGAITQFNSANEKYKPVNDFDLPNKNIYNEVNTMINEAENPKDYDFSFATKLKEIYPIYRCSYLLNYHFDKTNNKKQFLDHVEFHVLIFTFLKEEQTEKFEFIEKWINEKRLQIEIPDKLKEMLLCNNFKELIERHGEEQELLEQYKKGLDFAPDRKRYIEDRINIYENTLAKYRHVMNVWDKKQENRISYECGEYKRTGFAWVNNGYNGTKEDFTVLLYRNVNLQDLDTTDKGKNDIRLQFLYLLAKGGALAFHIAFLRKEIVMIEKEGEANKTNLSKGQMGNFNDFIIEVKSLKITLKELYIKDGRYIDDYTPQEIPGLPYKKGDYLDLGHYSQYKSDYENKIKKLQQLALNEVLLFTPDQINLQLKRLEQIERMFSKFWDLYIELLNDFNSGKLTLTDIEIKLYPLFIVPNRNTGIISQSFIDDLHDAIMFKQGILLGFIDQVNKVLGLAENTTNKGLSDNQTEIKGEQSKSQIKPIFKPEALRQIFDLLKDFFSFEHQKELLHILETGDNAREQLIFKDTGNRLADAFKQLHSADFITSCPKNVLENWVRLNFAYSPKGKVNKFKTRYLNDIISTNKDKCKKPILNVKLDKSKGVYVIGKA